MSYLILGIVTFIGIHLLPSSVTLRERIIDNIGQVFYVSVFSLLALAGLGLIIAGKNITETIEIWDPPFWAMLVPVVIMPVVFILLVAAYLPTNIKLRIRHPMLLAVLFWSAAHLTINGDLASIVLFGSFGLFSLFAMWSANRRGAHSGKSPRPAVKSKQKMDMHTETPRRYVSYSRLMQKQSFSGHKVSVFRDCAAILLGLITFTVILFLHNTLFGVSTFR